MRALNRFFADESGAGSVEYGLIAVCISVAIVTVLQGVGGKLKDALFLMQAEIQ